jgi:hypothetical protein
MNDVSRLSWYGLSRCMLKTEITATTAITASATTQRSRTPESRIIPARTAMNTSAMPSAGSIATNAIIGSPQASTSATPRSRGPVRSGNRRLARSCISLNSMAVIRMIATLPNSGGSIWKPPGRAIQPFEPLTVEPSGVSTATRLSSDTP